jgi:hypothetical protein
MVKYLLAFYVLCSYSLGFAQVNNPAMSIMEYEYGTFFQWKPDTMLSSRTSVGVYHKGSVLDGIKLLIDAQDARLKVKGKVPDEYIFFKVFSGKRNEDLEKILYDDLTIAYKFEVMEVMDTCEVLRFVVEDSTKLDVFSVEKNGPVGHAAVSPSVEVVGKPYNPNDWRFEAVRISYMAEYFEQCTKIPILYEDKDVLPYPTRYNFYFNKSIANDVNRINDVFVKKYGIRLKKEIGIIKKLQIEFFEKKE